MTTLGEAADMGGYAVTEIETAIQNVTEASQALDRALAVYNELAGQSVQGQLSFIRSHLGDVQRSLAENITEMRNAQDVSHEWTRSLFM